MQERIDIRTKELNTSQAELIDKHTKFDADLQQNKTALHQTLAQNKRLKKEITALHKRLHVVPQDKVQVDKVTRNSLDVADSPSDKSRDRYPGPSQGTPSTSSSWGDRPIPRKK